MNPYRWVVSGLPEEALLLPYDADGNLIRIADVVAADMHCDGPANFDDGDCFVAAVGCTDGQSPSAGYAGCLPCDCLLGDFDQDGDVDFADADLFSAQLPNFGVRMQLDWDAGNRLIRVVPESGREQSGDVKVEFEYDYRNRRVAKRVYTWDGTEWDLTATRKYVWDGWRLLLELDAGGETLMVLRAYTWGLDLAGQAGGPGGAGIVPAKPTAAGLLEGAGTIGGLLAVYDTYGTTSTGDDVRYLYLYDGNGNVGQLVDPVPGTYATSLFKARYEYDPYGTVVQKSGAYALGNRNPFQFSTKQWDPETGLGYWGVRYYRPDVGRWANRDPIEEAGGVNLYAYVMNEPVGGVDGLGYYSELCPRPPGLCGPVATSQPTSQPAAGSPSPPTEVDECSAMCRIYKAQGDPTVYRACLAGCRVFPDWECGPHCARFNNAQGKTPATLACEAGCTTVRAGRPRRRIPNNPLVPVNGCTSPLGDMPAGVDFGPACNEHDRCYGTCGQSKATCDEEFYADMMYACLGYPPCATFAELYYYAVRNFGQQYYCDAQAASGCPVQLECQ